MAKKEAKVTDITKTGPQSYRDLQRENAAAFNTAKANSSLAGLVGDSPKVRSIDMVYEGQEHSPLQMQTGGEDYWGKSMFDPTSVGAEDYNNLTDIRAENQPWYSQIANGLAKGVILAGTTFLDGIVGLIVGGTQGIVEQRWSALWDNPFSDLMQEINDASEEWLPNYYSQKELDSPWYENIFSANFIGDKFIKNLGFSVGALYSGQVITAPFKIPKVIKWINAIGRSTKAAPIVKSATGAFFSAVNEGRVEANINARKEFFEPEKRKLDEIYDERLANEFQPLFDAVQAEYEANRGKQLVQGKNPDGTTSFYDPAVAEYDKKIQQLRQELENRRNAREQDPFYIESLAKINEDRLHMGNMDLLVNLPILTASNIVQFAKFYSKGFDTARRSVKAAKRAGQYVPKSTKAGAAWAATKGALSEGWEEISQKGGAEWARDYYSTDVSNFIKKKQDPNAEQETLSFIKSFANSVNTTLNDGAAWEEFFIGALTGAMGVPMFRSPRGANGKFRSPIGLEGGIYDHAKEYREKRAREEVVAAKLNEIVQRPEFLNYYRGMIRHRSYQDDMDRAVEEGDKFNFKNAESAQFISDISMFDNAGRLDDLVAMIDAAYDTSDENLQAIIDNTTATTEDGKKIGPYIDENGNEMTATEEGKKQMIESLGKARDDMHKNINRYIKAKKEIDENTREVLDDSQLEELTWMAVQIQDWQDRIEELGQDSRESLKTLNEHLSSKIEALQAIFGERTAEEVDEENNEEATEETTENSEQKDTENTQENTEAPKTATVNNQEQITALTKKIKRLNKELNNKKKKPSKKRAKTIKENIAALQEQLDDLKKQATQATETTQEDTNQATKTTPKKDTRDLSLSLQKTLKNYKRFQRSLDRILKTTKERAINILSDPNPISGRYVDNLIAMINKNFNDAFFDAFFEAERTSLVEKLTDIRRLGKAKALYQERRRQYMTDSVLQKMDHKLAEEIQLQRTKAIKGQDLKTRFSKATKVSEFRDIYDNEEDQEVEDGVVDSMVAEGNAVAKNFKELSQYNKEIREAISNAAAVEENASELEEDAMALWEEHFKNAENVAQASNVNSVYLNNTDFFEDDATGERHQKARGVIEKALQKVAETRKKAAEAAPKVDEPGGNNDNDNTGDNDDTGDDTGSEVGELLPIGDDDISDIIDENLNNNDGAGQQDNSRGKRKYYRPVIPKFHIEASKEGDFRDFDVVVKEREGLDFSGIYGYLKDNGAFEYVDSGKLKVGDEIGFMIDPSFNDHTIFIVTDRGQVIGSIDESETSLSRYEGLQELVNRVRREYQEYNKNNKNKKIPGRRSYREAFNSVGAKIDGSITANWEEDVLDKDSYTTTTVLNKYRTSMIDVLETLRKSREKTSDSLSAYLQELLNQKGIDIQLSHPENLEKVLKAFQNNKLTLAETEAYIEAITMFPESDMYHEVFMFYIDEDKSAEPKELEDRIIIAVSEEEDVFSNVHSALSAGSQLDDFSKNTGRKFSSISLKEEFNKGKKEEDKRDEFYINHDGISQVVVSTYDDGGSIGDRGGGIAVHIWRTITPNEGKKIIELIKKGDYLNRQELAEAIDKILHETEETNTEKTIQTYVDGKGRKITVSLESTSSEEDTRNGGYITTYNFQATRDDGRKITKGGLQSTLEVLTDDSFEAFEENNSRDTKITIFKVVQDAKGNYFADIVLEGIVYRVQLKNDVFDNIKSHLSENNTGEEEIVEEEVEEDTETAQEESTQDNSNEKFFATPRSRVSKIMVGRVPYSSEERNLNETPGVNDSDATPMFGIIKNGRMHTRNKIPANKIRNPRSMRNKEGRLYLLIPDASGMYTPVAVRVKHLNTQEFDLDSSSIADTQVGKKILEAFEALARATDSSTVAAAMEKLGKVLYIGDVMVNYFNSKAGSGITISRKVRNEEDGSFVTYKDSNGVEHVREVKTNVYFQTKKNTVNVGGIEVDTAAAEQSGIDTSSAGQPKETSQILQEIKQAFYNMNLPLQVNAKEINDAAYNKLLVGSGILTSNLTQARVLGSWFTTDYFDDQGNLHTAENPSAPATGNKGQNPVGGTPTVVPGTRVIYPLGQVRYVELTPEHSSKPVIRDIKGNDITNALNENERRLAIDMAMAQEYYGNAREGSMMTDNKVVTADGLVLDRDTGKYLTGEAADAIKNKLKLRNQAEEARKAEANRVVAEIEENQKKVDKERTDGEYYYILEEDGEYHQYDRVHSRLGDNWIGPRNNTNSNRALRAGTAIDQVIRDFFNNKDNATTKPDIMSQEAYEQLLNTLSKIKDKMEAQGERFLANNIVVFHKYSDGTRVAGELDILAIDKHGNFRIYDVKTSKYDFHGPFFEEKGNMTRMSTKDYYTLQLSAYQNLFESQYGVPIKDLAILPFKLTYSELDQVTKVENQGGIKITYNPNTPVKKETVSPKDGGEYQPLVIPIFDDNIGETFDFEEDVSYDTTPWQSDAWQKGYYVKDGKVHKTYIDYLAKINGEHVWIVAVPKRSEATSNAQGNGITRTENRTVGYTLYMVFKNGKTIEAYQHLSTDQAKGFNPATLIEAIQKKGTDWIKEQSSEETLLYKPENNGATGAEIGPVSNEEAAAAARVAEEEGGINNEDEEFTNDDIDSLDDLFEDKDGFFTDPNYGNKKVEGLNIEIGKQYDVEFLKSLFTKFVDPNNKEIIALAERVFKVLDQLDIPITFSDSFDFGVKGKYTTRGGSEIILSYKFFTAIFTQDTSLKSQVILHEAIHAVTSYVLTPRMREKLTPELRKAADEINDVYNNIRNNPELAKEYGIKNAREMVAEMSNIMFRNKLKKINMWQKLKNAIKRLFTDKKTTAFDVLDKALDKVLDNFSIDLYNDYTGKRSYDSAMVDSEWDFYQDTYTQEMDNILKNAPRNAEGKLLAPNGEISNLTEKQYAQVRTKAFKNWFGDWENNPKEASKVVDENGEPLVVYHGGQKGINVFLNRDENPNYENTKHQGYLAKDRVGIYFSKYKSVAKNYASSYKKRDRVVYEVFLNIRNPYNQRILTSRLNTLTNLFRSKKERKLTPDLIHRFELEGILKNYDGINHSNGTELIVFNSNQIKSATDNSGTFSTSENNIYDETSINNVPEKVYHYSDNSELLFTRQKGGTKSAIFFTDNPNPTEGTVLDRDYKYSVRLDVNRVKVIYGTKASLHQTGTSFTEEINKAEKEGYDAVRFIGIDDNQETDQNVTVVFDPSRVSIEDSNNRRTESKKVETFNQLDATTRANLEKQGWTEKEFNHISQEEKDYAIRCAAL